MSDGRKTRGKIGQKNEKAKLDKEWNQVYKYIYGEGPGEKEGTREGGGSGKLSLHHHNPLI